MKNYTSKKILSIILILSASHHEPQLQVDYMHLWTLLKLSKKGSGTAAMPIFSNGLTMLNGNMASVISSELMTCELAVD